MLSLLALSTHKSTFGYTVPTEWSEHSSLYL